MSVHIGDRSGEGLTTSNYVPPTVGNCHGELSKAKKNDHNSLGQQGSFVVYVCVCLCGLGDDEEVSRKKFPHELQSIFYSLIFSFLKNPHCLTRVLERLARGHGGRVVTLSPPTSEAGDRFPSWP